MLSPVEQFESITGVNVQPFFERYVNFTQLHLANVANYYTGRSSKNNESFAILDQLIEERREIRDTLIQFKNQLNTTTLWQLAEDLSDIFSRIDTASRLPRWLRVATTNVAFLQSPEGDYLMQQNETVESIAIQKLGDVNGENTWKDIALRNDLIEEDYTLNGGKQLRVTFKGNLSSFDIVSVVDIIQNKSIYGKDIAKKLNFIDDDLETLDFDSTLLQSVGILMSIMKGSVPEFRDIGLQENLIAGTTRGSVAFPAIFRQIADVFATDDSFKNFTLLDLRFDQDVLILDFSIQTRLGETVNQALNV